MIFKPLLFAFAFGAISPSKDEIVVIGGQPTITISLDRSDLAEDQDRTGIEHRIRKAAISVCEQAYRALSYRETVACVKWAIADAEAQLERLSLGEPSASAAIAITIPATEH